MVKNANGYATVELLIVATCVLGIFSFLFSNFFPLVNEYEKKDDYNNLTALYAAHHLRKLYINALENKDVGLDKKAALNINMGDNNYYKALGNGKNNICGFVLYTDYKTCMDIIDEYDIESVIITNYKLDNLKSTYPKTGLFYNYIKYLPTDKNYYDGIELYRIILKTKQFGYATTKILSDYKTPDSCFVGNLLKDDEIEITDYLYDNGICNDKVVLSNNRVKIKDKNGAYITGFITSLGNKSFKDKKITSIVYSSKVTKIGDEAFKNTSLKQFEFSNYLEHIGKEAFSNTFIKEIKIPKGLVIDDYAFMSNKYLVNIDLSNVDKIMNKDNDVSIGTFKNCGNKKDVKVIFSPSMEYIGKEMFFDTYIKNINLSNTKLKEIEDNAFKMTNPNTDINFTLPSTLKALGNYSFYNNDIKVLSLTDNIEKIGSYSFAKTGVETLLVNGNKNLVIKDNAFTDNSIKKLDLKGNITLIGDYAFKNNKISNITIPKQVKTIGKGAFMGNNFDNSSIIKTYNNYNFCSIFFDKTNCDTNGNNPIKVTFNNSTINITIDNGSDLLD